MILSRGREAYSGKATDAVDYFASIGYPIPAHTNPAEFFLDLVNDDFVDKAEVNKVLDQWAEKKPPLEVPMEELTRFSQSGAEQSHLGVSFFREVMVMLRRHGSCPFSGQVLEGGNTYIGCPCYVQERRLQYSTEDSQ